MSATHCPHDGNFCQKKLLFFNTWQNIIQKNNGLAFKLNPEMFNDCPIEQLSEREMACDRYKRHLLINKNKALDEQR